MHFSRRMFLKQCLVTSASAAMLGCQRNSATGPRIGSTSFATSAQNMLPPPPQLLIDAAQKRAIQFLVQKQSPDGSWKSDTYGVFKDGTALTPLVLSALLAVEPEHTAAAKAAHWLADFVRADGSIQPPSYGFDFSLYTSALSVPIFSHTVWNGKYLPQRDAWLRYLRERQLTEALGWKPVDKPYGGWGYCRTIPRKAKGNELIPPLLESNLSATTFALEALKAGGVPAGDPAWQKALVFVKRCQNWNDDANKRDEKLDDGGFFFIYDDLARNKAGGSENDRGGRQRFNSYGSTTADGLRCLVLCGEKDSSSRVQAARTWLRNNFEANTHPGHYDPKRELDREGTYYYYAASMTRAPLEQFLIENGKKLVRMWIEALGDALLERQRADGSWANPAHAYREDEPLVATPFAMHALAEARKPHSVFVKEGDRPKAIR
ncbi:MAG TPA: prenyltransferase/squalene oxidase repeat-containing protein [Gemmataceae bacterium]|nr:prenyltransferase/squalene oxidase repeat-containing protein [Gemmataceae bacterium]